MPEGASFLETGDILMKLLLSRNFLACIIHILDNPDELVEILNRLYGNTLTDICH